MSSSVASAFVTLLIYYFQIIRDTIQAYADQIVLAVEENAYVIASQSIDSTLYSKTLYKEYVKYVSYSQNDVNSALLSFVNAGVVIWKVSFYELFSSNSNEEFITNLNKLISTFSNNISKLEAYINGS